MPGGHRSCSPHLEVAVACGSSSLEHRARLRTARIAMSTVATARATTCPRWHLTSGSRPDNSPGRQAAGTSLAADISLTTYAGHRPVRTPSVRTAVVPKAADGQFADRSDSLQLPLLFLKAGPEGGLRPGNDPPVTGEPASTSRKVIPHTVGHPPVMPTASRPAY